MGCDNGAVKMRGRGIKQMLPGTCSGAGQHEFFGALVAAFQRANDSAFGVRDREKIAGNAAASGLG